MSSTSNMLSNSIENTGGVYTFNTGGLGMYCFVLGTRRLLYLLGRVLVTLGTLGISSSLRDISLARFCIYGILSPKRNASIFY